MSVKTSFKDQCASLMPDFDGFTKKRRNRIKFAAPISPAALEAGLPDHHEYQSDKRENA
jgi:hypothetical protein